MNNKWIEIFKEYPDYSGRYLIAYGKDSAKMAVAYFSDIENMFYIHPGKEVKTVTHWQYIESPFDLAKDNLYKHLVNNSVDIDPEYVAIVNKYWKELLY